MWQLTAPEVAPISPSILYGPTPVGATETRAALQLTSGITYRVTVESTVGVDGIVGSGTITFQL